MNDHSAHTPVVITYGSVTIDPATLPQASLLAMLRKGLTHYLGNEVASRVTTWAKAKENATATDADKQAKADAIRAEFVEHLRNGTVAQGRVGGPKLDPLDVRMERIAKAQVLTILKANGIKAPKGDEAVQFADGTSKTLEAMIDSRLARFEDEIRKEAEKQLAAEARAAKKAAEAAQALKVEGAASAEGLGL